VAEALYFPFSRCLGEVALKQAVLLYDRLIFIDPVSAEERAVLYAGSLTAPLRMHKTRRSRCQRAEGHYRLLEAEGLVETVDAGKIINLESGAADWRSKPGERIWSSRTVPTSRPGASTRV
jgi:hypothetical protein